MAKYVLVYSDGTEICYRIYNTLEEAKKELQRQTSSHIDGGVLIRPNDEGSPVLDEDEVYSYVGETRAYLCPADKQVHINDDWSWEIIEVE